MSLNGSNEQVIPFVWFQRYMPVMLEAHWFALIMSIDISTSTGIYCEARIMLDDFRIALQLSDLRIKSLLFYCLYCLQNARVFPNKTASFFNLLSTKSKKDGKDPRGQPFPSRCPQGSNEQTRKHDKHKT